MRINTHIRLSDSIFHVDVGLATDGFTPIEEEAVYNFGEPIIDCGGDFTDGGDPALEYTLANSDRRFPSQFPVKQKFSVEDYPDDAYERAVLWRDTIKSRLDAGVTTKRNTAAGAVGEEISIIDTSN